MSVVELFDELEYGPAPESDKEARAWLAAKAGGARHFINGAWAEPADGGYFDSFNPATEERLLAVAQGSDTDIDRAVTAARAAQPAWAALPGFERAKYLYALARAIQRNSRLFAVLEAMDNGKSIRETRDLDIPLAARHFYHHAGWAEL
ncbi:MAG: aldehyde dehydrogenase family protein, partial [Alphaproteobacteria bacterium]